MVKGKPGKPGKPGKRLEVKAGKQKMKETKSCKNLEAL